MVERADSPAVPSGPLMAVHSQLDELARLRSRLAEREDTRDVHDVFFARMHEGAATVSSAGTIIHANQQLADMLGHPLDGILGTPFGALVHPGDRAAASAVLDGAQPSGRRDVRLLDAEAAAVPVHVSWSPLPPLAGEATVCVLVRAVLDPNDAQAYTRSLIEASLDALMTTDAAGTITDVNEQMVALTGVPREELVGSRFRSYVTDPQRAEDGIRLVLAEGRVTNYELTVRARDGGETAVSYNATTFSDPAGTAQGVFAAARDVTERNAAEELLRTRADEMRDLQAYSRSLLEASLDALMTTDAAGTITDVNEQMVALTGAPRSDLIGTRFRTYVTEPQRAEDGIRLVLAEGRVTDYELTVRARDGHETVVSYNATIFNDPSGKPRGVFAAARDVTERKSADQLLRARARQHEAVVEIGVLALADTGYPALLDASVSIAARTLDVEYVRMLDLRPSGDLVVRAAGGLGAGKDVGTTVPGRSGSQAAYALVSGRPVVADDLRSETRFRPSTFITRHRVKSGVTVAVGLTDKPSGVLGAYTIRSRHFTADDVGFLESVANVLATARQRTEAEESARLQSEQYAAMLATTSDGFSLVDPAGRIVDVNDVYCRLVGYTREELLGETLGTVEALETGAEIADRLRRCMRDGFDRFETRHRAKDGHLVDVEVSVAYAPRLERFVVFVRDMSERARAEHALAHMRGLLDRSEEISKAGGWEYDLATDRITWTDEVYRIHGLDKTYDPNDLPQDIGFYGPDASVELEAALARAVSDGEPYDLELDLIRADGTQIWVRTTGVPVLEDGRVARVSGNIVDISERKRAEDALRTLNAELEEHVAARTQELSQSNQELQAFAYSISHDLRAPLRAMDGFSEVLTQQYGRQLDEQGRHYLARIRAGAQRMGTMIDALLQLSRVSRAELRRELVDLSGLAQAIVAELERAEPWRRVELVIPAGITAQGDPALLQIVLGNLLSNAWKFTSSHEHARIDVGTLPAGGRTAYFVRDNGVGFDMAHYGQLFTPFQRLHHVEEFPGTGIGLASVRRIVSRHGGRIWAEAEPGRGATFTFTLEPEGDH